MFFLISIPLILTSSWLRLAHADSYGAHPATIADLVCHTLGELGNAESIKQQAFANAWKDFQGTLEPDLKAVIQEPRQIAKPMKEESSNLPSGTLRNDPWLPNNIEKIRKQYPAYEKRKEQFLQLQARYEAALYSAANLGSADSKYDISPTQVETRATELSKKLIKKILHNETIPQETRQMMIEKLDGVEVVTAHSLSLEKDPYNLVIKEFLFFGMCGEDYSTINAFATLLPDKKDALYEKGKAKGVKPGAKLRPVFFVCPALATSVAHLKYKSLGLDWILTHELSHLLTFQTVLPENGTQQPDQQKLWIEPRVLEAHQGMFNCLQKNYEREFRSLESVIGELTPICEEQKKKDTIAAGFFQLSREQAMLYQAKSMLTGLEKYLGHPPTSIDSHAAEILADFWTIPIIADEIREHTEQSFEMRTASAVALFCTIKSLFKDNFFANGDEGIHPSSDFRIENLLRNPELDSLLQQSNLVKRPSGPWCAL